MISMVCRIFIATILIAGVEIRAYTGTQKSPDEAIAATSLHKEHEGYFPELS